MHTRAWIGARLPLANAAQFLASPRLCRTHSHRRSIQAQDCWSNTAIATGPQHVRVQANTLGLSLSVCRGKRGTALVVTSASGNGDAPANDTWLVVGLGNPGAQYEDTRHNIGFKIIDCLGAEAGVAVTQKQHNALVGKGRLHGVPVLLAKPTTFMNSSGKAVRKLMDYYKVQQDHVLVIYDDLDLPTAKTRLRAKGGHGGHNGMRSIVAMLGNSLDFARIRVGIGRPAGQRNIADYVLEDFAKDEWKEMQFGIQDTMDIVKAVLVEGMDRAISGVRA